MTKNVMLSLLAQGNTGDEILQILDVIAEEGDMENTPTLEEIAF
jgi:hypothetical protein